MVRMHGPTTSARMPAMTATAAGTSVEPSRPRLPWVLLGLTVALVTAMFALSLGEVRS